VRPPAAATVVSVRRREFAVPRVLPSHGGSPAALR
jgi:hypothetical protein